MMCRGHSHIRMYYKKKRSNCFSIRSSFSFSSSSFFLALFIPSFSRSLVSVVRRYQNHNVFLHCFVLAVMGGETERMMRNAYTCICALIDYIYIYERRRGKRMFQSILNRVVFLCGEFLFGRTQKEKINSSTCY